LEGLAMSQDADCGFERAIHSQVDRPVQPRSQSKVLEKATPS